MIISEISLNTYEIKILKLLSKRDRTALEISKIVKDVNFSTVAKTICSNRFIEVVHGPGKTGMNTCWRITADGRAWLNDYKRRVHKKATSTIVSNTISFLAGLGSGLLVAYLTSLFGWN